MKLYGVSCLFHDAALAVVKDDRILYASHSERYSKKKGDKYIHPTQVLEAQEYEDNPDAIIYYESPFNKWTRQWYSGEQRTAFSYNSHLKERFRNNIPILKVGHHESHACAGYYTSPFTNAIVVVIDAIGEWDTLTIWRGQGKDLQLKHRVQYPHSLGLLYSAFTERCGFKPNEEEYIMMGLAAYGEPLYVDHIKKDFIEVSPRGPAFKLKQNVHTGIGNWLPDAELKDIAASIQVIIEDYLCRLFEWLAVTYKFSNVVFMGGVALNCVANGKLLEKGYFNNMWIMPNPGDAGSSLGAALAWRRDFVEWKGPFLGTNIPILFDSRRALEALKNKDVIGVAHGRAEFGPRALGNRSILADPRSLEIKNKVNDIKQRQEFRPFGAVVLEEEAPFYFRMPATTNLPYMQHTVQCIHPDLFPAICHNDQTTRIQTVSVKDHRLMYDLLKRWHADTGCPILLNTSLNIKGMPLVNTWKDAMDFKQKYKIEIF